MIFHSIAANSPAFYSSFSTKLKQIYRNSNFWIKILHGDFDLKFY